ncbi:MAG: cell division ATP-binding protein FtsE, partial [Allomuricauda sp.]
FQNENLILNHITLQVKKGEFVYVIGKTGSGKSSFMKTLYADLPLKQGSGTIVDFDLKNLEEKQIPYLRRKLGIVFQDFKLLPDRNVNNNLRFVLKATGWTDDSKMDAKIEEVLDKVGMKTKGFKFPHELSGGEQQRIAIARALLNDPEIILADEPTGNLDPQTSVEVMKVLQDINQTGRTIIMATHDYDLILKYPHKTLKCDGSKVFEVIQKAV